MFKSSVCSYPNRGHYGKSNYRGNCTGHIIRDFFETYHKRSNGLAADPSIGSGTSVDVAREMGLRFKGTDLHSGFNLLVDDFASHLKEQAHTVWWHPPYAQMLQYSGDQWGDEPHPWDMSRMPIGDFCEALSLALMNIHDATENNGVYGILMGNWRNKGRYYNLSSLVERATPGKQIDEIIKIQHNCVSDRTNYRGNFVKIEHEKLLIFRKQAASSIAFLGMNIKKAERMVKATWTVAVRRVMQGKTQMTLKEIYIAIEPYARTTNNNNTEAKVRQVVQNTRFFTRIVKGTYTLAA